MVTGQCPVDIQNKSGPLFVMFFEYHSHMITLHIKINFNKMYQQKFNYDKI